MVKNKTHKKINKKMPKSKKTGRAKPSAARVIVDAVKDALKPKTERVEVTIIKKTLGKAPEEYHFVLHDGRRLKSLYELVDELETMSEEAFRDHVNEFKNDFATWAGDVFHAPDLSEELKRLRSKFETQKAIMKHLLRDAQKVVEHVQKSGHK